MAGRRNSRGDEAQKCWVTVYVGEVYTEQKPGKSRILARYKAATPSRGYSAIGWYPTQTNLKILKSIIRRTTRITAEYDVGTGNTA